MGPIRPTGAGSPAGEPAPVSFWPSKLGGKGGLGTGIRYISAS